MKNLIFKASFLILISLALFSAGNAVFAYQLPTANAGPDLYTNAGQTVVLQGSGFDPAASALTYYWNCNGGTLSSSTVAQPTFTAPTSSNTSYNCSLTVTNAYSLSASDSMIVNINAGSTQIGGAIVQTNSATNISNNQATLNANLSIPYLSGYNYVWFQWGSDTNYGNTTPQQTLGSSGSFSQNIANLSANTNYHFRATAQTSGSTIYGQDMTFNSNGSGTTGTGLLSVSKQVINISSGNLNWQSSVTANPGNILSFAIILQAPTNQDIHNVTVTDILPANIIYKDNLTINASLSSSGNPASGINVGTIPAGGVEIISYQAQVASAQSFAYGTTTLSSDATITSTEGGTQTSLASAVINNSSVLSATTVSTGMTNNPITDSFFLPIMLIILGSWFYFSGNVYVFADWIGKRL